MNLHLTFPFSVRDKNRKSYYEFQDTKTVIIVEETESTTMVKKLHYSSVMPGSLESYIIAPENFVSITKEEFAMHLDNAIISITAIPTSL